MVLPSTYCGHYGGLNSYITAFHHRKHLIGERISFCMRVSDGARKINRHGGAIFSHDDWRKEKGIDVRVAADIPQSPIAPIKIRDFVYGKPIDLSPTRCVPGFWEDSRGFHLWKPKEKLWRDRV